MAKSWEQILGGYATDTLTEEEKSQLFNAALQDQALFDALADEEAFKVLLADPKARERILASLQHSKNSQWIVSAPSPWLSWFRRSSSLAWAGSVAAAGLALIFGWQMNKDWGSMVEQEQRLASVREGLEETDEMALQSEPSKPEAIQKSPQDIQKKILIPSFKICS